jgi:hypothetical protein
MLRGTLLTDLVRGDQQERLYAGEGTVECLGLAVVGVAHETPRLAALAGVRTSSTHWLRAVISGAANLMISNPDHTKKSLAASVADGRTGEREKALLPRGSCTPRPGPVSRTNATWT